ncbi:ATP-binding protein [Aspergillus mulundensis]|uniref:AAA protein C-terminal winged helix domain-containing protein n=1 Tax=Aspergillus mulundensis TaxID=1810919 RepID=A0A3D8QN35_9EURO|nr:hypothetical protein DSM5745_10310 [Aspergillus mulundensis]RDW63199.1 hypothetical protein DSM5745_10310 [Aspergillus mulundensis]
MPRIRVDRYGIWFRLFKGKPLRSPWAANTWSPRRGHGRRRTQVEEEPGIIRKFLENGATTIAALLMLGVAGYSYHVFYKRLVLRKIDNAFSPGFSSLELAALAQHGYTLEQGVDSDDGSKFRVTRPEQGFMDDVVSGKVKGHYYLLFGEKGTGKTSMLLESMQKVHGDGVGMLEAHGDIEVFRLRLGKAIDYEYHEDYIGGMFSIRGPRDSTALLDIERALNKLEKVALARKGRERPLVLIVNNLHYLPDNTEGQQLMDLLQQRAEMWAASGLVTLVFTSDQYRTTEMLRLHATRMRVLNIQDVTKDLATQSLKAFRRNAFREDVPSDVLDQVYSMVGGRLIHLDQVARSKDMLKMCQAICEKEKRWLLCKCWILGAEMDDKAEDQQDLSSGAMLLGKTLVQLAKDKDRTHYVSGLPGIALHKAQELMTRADLIKKLDEMNIIAIDADAIVRADSVPMQNAFQSVCSDPEFEEHLAATLERLDELEGLGRTTELRLKDFMDDEYEIKVQKRDGDTYLSVQKKPEREE